MRPLLASCLLASAVFAADAPVPAGSLIVSTPFDQPQGPTRKKAINGWSAAIGEWSVKDGALFGDELKEDNHHSSCTYRVDAGGIVIQAQFRLGGAQYLAFGCRDTVAPNLHLARTFVSKDAVWITHMSGIAKTTKSAKVAELKTPVDPTKWHDIRIEIVGDRYRVRLDDKELEATHPRFKDRKGLVALITKGQGAAFRQVTLQHAGEAR